MKRQWNRIIALFLCLTFVLAAVGCSQSGAGTTAAPTSEETAATEEAGIYTPGEYTAVAKGYGGDVTVTITVDANAITNVVIKGDSETPGIGSLGIEQMPAQIMEAQSADVDGVSACSFTSKAVREAAAAAIAQAKGETASKAEVKMAPGAYEAQGWGYSVVDPVKVTVTVTEDKMTDIQVVNNWEDTRENGPIMDTVIKYLVPQMLEYQTVKADAICGATASSNGVKAAVENALAAALAAGGSDASAIQNFYVEIPKSTATETLDTDILIVGMGGSGCATAVSAAEAMKKAGADLTILAIDKTGKYGGTSANCGEPMGVNPPRYKEEFNNGEDYMDKAAFRQAWIDYTEGDEKTELLDVFLDNNGDTIDWLYYDHGFRFTNAMSGFSATDTFLCKFQYVYYFNAEEGRDYGMDVTQGTRADTVAKYFDRFVSDYEDLGGKYQLNTEAYELLTDEKGAVTGVKARNTIDGTEYVIRAKAVVMACGGFIGNPEMQLKYLSDEYYHLKDVWRVYGMAQNDGTLMEYAIENLNAATYNIEMPPMVHFKTLPHPLEGDYEIFSDGEMTSRAYAFLRKNPMTSYGGIVQNMALNDDCLWVDTEGNRFCNENGTFQFWKAGPYYYNIWGADEVAYVAENGFPSCGLCTVDTKGGYATGVPVPEIYDAIDDAVEQGLAYKGETIEELAEQMGVPAENLKKAIENYNAACAAGEDKEFGKKPEKLIPLGENGPYYCFIGQSVAYSTCGGLDIDTEFHVLNTDGEIIEGLYAVGTDSMGVLYSPKKAYVTFGGGALGWAFTSGRLTGGIVVEEVTK